jgi:biopolymer transport protein ExbB/TolQ
MAMRPISTMHALRQQTNDDGTDIFKQAMANQKRKEQEKQQEKKPDAEEKEEEAEDVISEEDKKNKENIGWAVGLGALASYIYLGTASSSRLG